MNTVAVENGPASANPVGALLAGSLADALGVRWAIGVIGALTFVSGLIVATVMYETRQRRP